VELRAVAVDGAVAAQGADDTHAGLELDVDGDGLGARRQDVVELLVEDLDEVGGLAGEAWLPSPARASAGIRSSL
jgi:hypothetical protein